MSQKDTLISRLRSRPKDFTIDELDSLMKKCGCRKVNRGKTSGSAIAYFHEKTERSFKIHTPHPGKIIKTYVVKDVIEFLEDVGEI